MAERSYFQAWDIVHIWSDSRRLQVSYVQNQIAVSSEADLSHDAEKVCKFISFIIGRHWTYRTVKEDNQYKTIFYDIPLSCGEGLGERLTTPPSEPEPSKPKRGTKPKEPKSKTLFD
jgi:hypothetical protein